MDRVLADAARDGRRATVTTVERALDIPHATFDRNYRHLIDQFQRQARQQQATDKPEPGRAATDTDKTITRLRRENEDLRRLVKIYAESIRQLTIDRDALHTALQNTTNITALPTRITT
jgi:predicted Zn-dependent peptidase